MNNTKERKAIAAAARDGTGVDWLAVALCLGGTKADGSVDCRSAGTWLGVSASTVRRWLRDGPGLAAAERISRAAGVPRPLVAPSLGVPFI